MVWARMVVTIGSCIILCCRLVPQWIVACRCAYSFRSRYVLPMVFTIVFVCYILDRFISLFIVGCIHIFGGRSYFRFLARMFALDRLPPLDRASYYVVGWFHSGLLRADVHIPSDPGTCCPWFLPLCLCVISWIASSHCLLLGVYTSLVGGHIFVSWPACLP